MSRLIHPRPALLLAAIAIGLFYGTLFPLSGWRTPAETRAMLLGLDQAAA